MTLTFSDGDDDDDGVVGLLLFEVMLLFSKVT
jgi:hypothetical protein